MLTSSFYLIYVTAIKDLLFLFFHSATYYFLKHNYDHVICLLKSLRSLLRKEQKTPNKTSLVPSLCV